MCKERKSYLQFNVVFVCMCVFVFYIFAKACFLWSFFLQGCDERRQVGELEQILIA